MSNEKLSKKMDCAWRCVPENNCVKEVDEETQFCISAIIVSANIELKEKLIVTSNDGVVEVVADIGGQKKAEVSNGIITFE